MLGSEIISAMVKVARTKSPEVSEVLKLSEVGGGCINRAHRVKTNGGVFFVKVNSESKYPGMFEAEARGLGLLSGSGEIAVPEVVGFGNAGGLSFLVLVFVESHIKHSDFWEKFGRSLAGLHNKSANQFGLDHDNYIGSLKQTNSQEANWEEFFIMHRLLPQLRMARQEGLLPEKTEKQFGLLFRHLSDFFPREKPSLLHGDLWGGNYIVGENGQAVVIDPAVYYGHRYMDLGMTKLFGGFPEYFYGYYNERFPLEKGWQDSLEVANLYPLMVHVNLFGGGYLSSVNQILRRFA